MPLDLMRMCSYEHKHHIKVEYLQNIRKCEILLDTKILPEEFRVSGVDINTLQAILCDLLLLIAKPETKIPEYFRNGYTFSDTVEPLYDSKRCKWYSIDTHNDGFQIKSYVNKIYIKYRKFNKKESTF